MGSLREDTFDALTWVTVGVFFSTVFSSLSTLILANILAPAVFGLMSLALLATQTANLFRRLGLGDALIVSDQGIERASDTAFVLLVAVAGGLYGLLFLVAPLVAAFFDEAVLTAAIRVLGLTLVLHSFAQVSRARLERDLEFRELVLPNVANSGVRVLVAVSLGLLQFGIWSLVFAEVCAVLVSTGIILSISPYRPSVGFDRAIAVELVSFGSHVTLSGLASYAYKKIDDFTIGWVIGTAALGQYGIALAFANLPETLFNQIPTKALFPTFSKLDRDGQRRLWYLSVRSVSVLSIPAGIGLLVIAPDLIPIVVGDEWLPAVPVLQVLAVYGTLRSLASGAGNVLKTTGNVDVFSRLMTAQAVSLAVLIYPLTATAGIVGAGGALVASSLINYGGQIYFSNRALGLQHRRLLVPFAKYGLLGGIMGAAVSLLRTHVDGAGVLYLGFVVLTGVVIYSLAIIATDRPFLNEAVEELELRSRLPVDHLI